jgi:hypothetical protein
LFREERRLLPARGKNPTPAIAGRRGLSENAALNRPPRRGPSPTSEALPAKTHTSTPLPRYGSIAGVGGDELRQEREPKPLAAVASQVVVEIAEDGAERLDLDSVGAGAVRESPQTVAGGGVGFGGDIEAA